MQLRLLWSPLLKFASKLWPRKIILKVALSNIVVLAVTITCLAFYAYYDKSTSLNNMLIKQYTHYAKKVADLSENYLIDEQVYDLELLLASVMMLEGEHALYVKDVGFNTLISLHTDGEKLLDEIPEVRKEFSPVAEGEYVSLKNGKLLIWQQIGKLNKRGWVRITKDVHSTSPVTIEFIKVIITAMIFSVIVTLLMLQRILREPMQSLRRAAEFSQWLEMTQGNRLQLRTSSNEVEQLIDKLNYTSEKLFQNSLAQKSQHILVEAIREIQTKYIESKDKQDLYDQLLSKIVNLSKSETGFFAEVKVSNKGKRFLVMKSFSNLAENVSTQKFISKYSPPGMEFHNTHNLFGVVLQTEKPVIANDAQGDPRRGGLPPGHPEIYTFMSIPVFHEKELVAVVGLANRRPNYDRLVMEYLQPLLDTAANIVVAYRDKDKQIHSIVNLQQQEALLRRILSTVSDSVITINSGGFIDMVNPATENMFGYLREEILSHHVNSVIPGLFGSRFYENYLKQDVWHIRELSGRRKSGVLFPIEFSVSEFKIGDEQLFTITVNDISHLRDSESQKLNMDREITEFQDIVQAGYWSLHLKSRNFKASRQVFNILGFSEAVNDIDFNELVNRVIDSEQEMLRLAITRSVVDKEAFVIDLCLKPDNGERRYIQMQGQVSSRDENNDSIVAGVIQNVTEFRQVLQMKDEFISSISEEIRSPLTTIRGSIGLLAGDSIGRIDGRTQELLDTAYRKTDRLILFVNDLIDIENISLGRTRFNMEFLECRKILETAINMNEALKEKYSIDIKLTMKSRDMVFIVDKNRILQLLDILISNAARHSSPGKLVELTAELLDSSLVITVRDSGTGIPVDVQDKLFDLYARNEVIHFNEDERTGLGLCLAKAIVDRHQGTIKVQSTPGLGSTFYVQLPVPQQNVAVLNI